MQEENKIEKMYYYTTTETMIKILQNGNLFATNLKYLNDEQEFINGLEAIKDLCCNESLLCQLFGDVNGKKIKKLCESKMTQDAMLEYMSCKTKYSISFCADKDLLSQWTTYARESGVSMEMFFDLEQDKEFIFYKKESKTREKRELSHSARPKSIFYLTQGSNKNDKGTEKDVLRSMFPLGYDSGDPDTKLIEKWKENSAYIKQNDFHHENEYRIVFDYIILNKYDKTNKQNVSPRIDYRVDKHVIKPYLDVECRDGWPITSIMVGPGFNQKIVYNSVKFFIDHSQIRSSVLCTKGQWKEQIQRYIDILEKLIIDKTWENEKEQLLNRWKKEQLEEKIEDAEKNIIYNQIEKLMRQYMGKDDYTKPYFSKCGIILECSQIPYIY